MKNKHGFDAFPLALLGNVFVSLFLAIELRANILLLWAAHAWLLALGMTCVENQRKNIALPVFLAALACNILLILQLPPAFKIHGLLMEIGVLLLLWPLRFLALGEIGAALLFGAFYWTSCLGIGGTEAGGVLLIPCSVSLLFATLFCENAARYAEQKAVQHFSLPVLLGNLIPALDRHLQRKPCPSWLALIPALLHLGLMVWMGMI